MLNRPTFGGHIRNPVAFFVAYSLVELAVNGYIIGNQMKTAQSQRA